ncbi:Stk1 family PASTA domain-containing Ser/Thr kinase [Anaerobacillus sp. MEB173]|uniref:Stk1 family PASTA domain-containing Ser/Thr kinase n=1 Tax=Anaerobacillus sp. MEB173 TaxID=3383345 RepID=UPI003F907F21
MIGRRLNGRYEILETIGGGGMANVYKAMDIILDRHVAVKVLRPQFSDDDEFIKRFHREAQAATSLSHPNIVNIFDVGEEDNLYFIVMEYVEGPTLKQLIQQKGSLPLEDIVHIMSQIASAISHAHANQIIHRDIKPHNILISRDGDAKVTDFGIARAMTSATITHTNSVMGTVHYLSPEQARGGLVNTKSDIYSLGIVLYEMVTGKVPFSGDSAVSIAIKHLQSEIPSPKFIHPELPQSIENIILKATAKDPFHRYESAIEMEQDLQTALDPERINEAKFIIPNDDEEATKAIPIIKEEMFENDEETKVITPSLSETKENQKETNKQTPVPKNKKKKLFSTLFIILFLLIGSVVAAFIIMPKLFYIAEVEVPDLHLMEFEEAVDILTEKKLDFERIDVYDNEVEEGFVVKQDPASGITVKENYVVKVFVSEGKEKVEMKEVTGLQRNVVERMLEGFEKVEWIPRESEDAPEGTVLSQIPSAGDLIIPEKTTVFLTYSSGQPKFSLRDLRGLSESEVRRYFNDTGLYGSYKSEFHNEVREGNVISHTPPPFTQVTEGTEVVVVLSKGQKEIPVEIEEKPVEAEEATPYKLEVPITIPMTEEQTQEGITYNVRITYIDATTSTETNYIEETIRETTRYMLPLTINPNDEATFFVYINGVEAMSKTYEHSQFVN